MKPDPQAAIKYLYHIVKHRENLSSVDPEIIGLQRIIFKNNIKSINVSKTYSPFSIFILYKHISRSRIESQSETGSINKSEAALFIASIGWRLPVYLCFQSRTSFLLLLTSYLQKHFQSRKNT